MVLLYTSGTEPRPKGAVHSHDTLGYENRTMIELFRLTAEDVMWAPSPIAHITGVLYAFHLGCMLGSPVVLQDVWNAEDGLDLIEADRRSFVVAATPFLHGITYSPELAQTDVSSLRIFVCGGADVPPGLIRDAGRLLGVRAMRLYGSTEIPTLTSSSAEAPLELRSTTDGRAIADAELWIVDDDGREVAPGTSGRLIARGAEAMLGYLDVPAQPFDDEGWLDTGDLGRMDGDGYVQIVGRRKDIILRGGENISAKEVEDLLYGHPDIADVAVVAYPDPRLTERACAVVVPRSGTNVDLASIVAFLDTQSVARQKFPEWIEIVDELSKTPAGKIQKFRLRQLVAERSVGWRMTSNRSLPAVNSDVDWPPFAGQSADVQSTPGRVAVVTGAARGIGAATAVRLAEDGYDAAVLDLEAARCEATVAAVSAVGRRCTAAAVDVADEDSVTAAVQQVVQVQDLGPPAVLVDHAGVLHDAPLAELAATDWHRLLRVHLTGAFQMTRAAHRFMLEGGWGRIVLLSSTAAVGDRNRVHYSTSKAGLQGFTKALALELGGGGITVSCVAPGFTVTDMTRGLAAQRGIDFDKLSRQWVDTIAVGRAGTPQDIAHAISFFADERSGFVSGQVMYVAGGPVV